MEEGDQIHTEFDACFMGYIAQFNQSFSLGEPSKEYMDIYNIAIESVNNALNILKPGITVGELNEVLTRLIKKSGYISTNPNFHGLGLAIEEPFGVFATQPDYKPNLTRIIEPGMVIGFEPSVVRPDFKAGTTLGSPVLVTETGNRLLSKNWKPEVKII